MQREWWCQQCQQYETEEETIKRHVRSLTPTELALTLQGVRPLMPKEEKILARFQPGVVVSTPEPRPELLALAERIRRLRQALGLSQSALAKALGVQVLSVKHWESGRVRPRLKIMKRLEELEASSDRVGPSFPSAS